MKDNDTRWDEFTALCRRLAENQNIGRASLRRPWKALWRLYHNRVRPSLTDADIERLLGKPPDQLDPEENDLKALVAYAAGQGTLELEALKQALSADNINAPLFFLAGLSGKAFGESISPEICKFWLADPTDKWEKRPARELYDVEWTPRGLRSQGLRIEIKASSEHPAYRFQQIRHPRAGNQAMDTYDALLCLGVTASTVEFWLMPASAVADSMAQDILKPQHGGTKRGLSSNTYWFTMSPENRQTLREYAVNPGSLRHRALAMLQQRGRPH